jgi:AraC-like DNA-binding protein
MEMAELRTALLAVGYVNEMAPQPACPALDTAARVPASLATGWFDAAEVSLGDPLVGLHAGAHVQPRGALVHLIMSAPTLGDSLRYLQRFSRLLIDALQVTLVPQGVSTRLVFVFDDPQLASHRHLIDYSLLATVSVLRGAMGEAFRLSAVHRRRASQRFDGEQHEQLFKCPVRFSERDDSLVFVTHDLEIAPRVANPLVAEQMEKLAEALAGRVAAPLSCRTRVEAAVRAALARGRRAERARIASQLAMSEATLSRRLAQEGVTFKQLRETVLWELVDVLLANPTLKLEAVAASVGFSDAAAFSKALKRRTGHTPRAARAVRTRL